LHDAGPDEVIRIWPQKYKSGLTDHDNTSENSNKLPPPLHFSLKAGDAVLFHSEQLHASPMVGHTRRRFSFDLRIAADSRDDNSHYRKDFLDVRNFASEEKADLYPWAQAESVTLKTSEICATYWLNRLGSNPGTANSDIEELQKSIDHIEYAEDFLIAISRLARNAAPDFSDACLNKAIKESNLPFFILEASRELIAHGKTDEAKIGLEKIIKSGEVPLPDYTPIIYKNKQITQILPKDLVLQSQELLKSLSA